MDTARLRNPEQARRGLNVHFASMKKPACAGFLLSWRAEAQAMTGAGARIALVARPWKSVQHWREKS